MGPRPMGARRKEASGHARPSREDFSAVDFANTVACSACRAEDGLSDLASYRVWAARRRAVAPGTVTSSQLAELRSLRGAVRDVFGTEVRGTEPSSLAIEALNRASRRSVGTPILRRDRGHWSVRVTGETSESVARFSGAIARSAFATLTGTPGHHLRACLGPGCAHFLLARTRTQRWCSPSGCGNRVRVARHYWKKRSRGPGRSGRSRRGT